MNKQQHFIKRTAAVKLTAISLFLLSCNPNSDNQEVAVIQAAESVDTTSSNLIRRTVPFVTLRNQTGSTVAAEYYGGERNTIHTGYCDVSWEPIPMMKPIANKLPFYIPHEKIKLEAILEINENDFWRDPRSEPVNDHPLLYIHGYNIGFQKSCIRAAIFQENLHLGGRFLLLSWPSNDAVSNYTHDEADIYWSAAGIEQTLERMIRLFGLGSVDVVGHSMGTRGAMLSLMRMSRGYSGDTPLLNRLVLLAPDIDADIFRQYLEMVLPLARHITVYVSENDSALTLSEEVHGYPRLGQPGPHLHGLNGIDIIDVSETGMQRASGHLYHLYNNTVIKDLDQLLNGNRPASERARLQQDLEMGINYWKLYPVMAN